MNLTERHRKIIMAEICPYCDQKPKYVDSAEVYGKSYGMIYLCKPCGAWVGVHKGTRNPLGRLANKNLREWKIKAHDAFDPLWKNGFMSRKGAYVWLSNQLSIPYELSHIGYFGVQTCQRVVSLLPKIKLLYEAKI